MGAQGVPFIAYRDNPDGPLRLVEWQSEDWPEQITHIAFPEPVAARLVDPDDPAVRERLWGALYVIAGSDYFDGVTSNPTNAEMDVIVEDVLAALKAVAE